MVSGVCLNRVIPSLEVASRSLISEAGESCASELYTNLKGLNITKNLSIYGFMLFLSYSMIRTETSIQASTRAAKVSGSTDSADIVGFFFEKISSKIGLA